MASRRPTLNFVTSPSGLLVPEVTDDAVNNRTDISYDIAPATAEGWVLTTQGGEVVWAEAGAGDAGVDTIAVDGETGLTGDVTLSEGSNITLTQTGQDIEIAAGGGGVTVLNYTENTSNVLVSSSSESSPTVVITASAGIAVDGSTLICAEFYAPTISASNSAAGLLNLWDDTAGTRLGRIWAYSAGNPATSYGIFARRFFTPSAGTRTYSVRGWRVTSDFTVVGGAGGTAAYFPMYLRLTSGG